MTAPLGIKRLRAIMDQKRRRNRFLKNLSPENRFAYNQQINFCVSSIQKAKLEYFNYQNQKNVIDNKLFWNKITPCFSDNGTTRVKYPYWV